MATRRFSYKDDWVLKDGNIGINSETPAAKLDVGTGTIKAENIKGSGITTLTTYSGYLNKNTGYLDNVTINSGDSSTLSGEVVIGTGLTMTIGTGATTGQGSIDSLKVSNTFTPPIGGTDERPLAPKPGALFYNKDFKTIEYWDGKYWRQVDNIIASGRAVLFGGNHNPASSSIADITTLSTVTQGEEIHFGDLTQGSNAGSGFGSATRGICLTGKGVTPEAVQYVAIQSLGDSVTFGDSFSAAYRTGGAFSSSTRGVTCGGRGNPGLAHNIIQYVTISTLGDAKDFGDLLINGRGQGSGFASPVRGFCHGNANYTALIQFVNIASTGDAVNFGDNTYGGSYNCGNSNSVRGSIAGGYQFPGASVENEKSYVIMASTGMAYEFGDLSSPKVGYCYSASNHTRGFVAGGMIDPNSPNASRSTIDSFLFESKGEIVSWGDLNEGKRDGGSTTDCHGGLGGF